MKIKSYKCEKMENMINEMIKNYTNCKLSIYPNDILIIRGLGISEFKCFYHFDFENYQIRSCYWNSKKKWINKTINI